MLEPSDHAVLDFERAWWMHAGPKGEAIRIELSMSSSAYYRRLAALIDRPEAEQADPLLVRRLRRARADRRRTRHIGPQWKRSQSMSEQSESPRRRRRQPPAPPSSPAQGSAAKGIVLVVVAVLIGIGLLRDDDAGTTTVAVGAADDPAAPDNGDSATSSSTTSTTAPPRAPADVKVLVANGSEVSGAAGAQTDALEALGYVAANPTNADLVPATVVYFTVGYQAEAEVLATAIGAPATAVKALPTPAPVGDMQLSNLLIVVGPDLASAG